MGIVLVGCTFVPRWGGRRGGNELAPARLATWATCCLRSESSSSWSDPSTRGLATPTESAALGVIAALVLAGIRGQLTVAMLKAAFEGTMRTTAMVMLIIMAAFFLNLVLATIGLTAELIGFVQRSGLTPLETILLVIVFYLVLGCFMETLAMTITTVPVVTEIVVAVGYDPVWFGVLVMLLTETALITPPVGVNLFVVQGGGGRGAR